MLKLKLCLVLFILTLGCKNSQREENVTRQSDGSIVQITDNPTTFHSALPRLYANDNGLYLSWVTQQDSISHLQYALFTNHKWEIPKELSTGNDWFVNWADFPQISENEGYILSSFLQKSASGTYTYDVRLKLLNVDKADEMKNDFILHDDGTESEHGFVSISPWKDQFFVSWLDGRNSVGGHEDHSLQGGGAMTIRGAFVDTSGTINNSQTLDNRVCDCCNTASASTQNGIIVAYRDRSEEEVRDISVVRFEDGQWGQPMTIGNDGWKIAGCPVNGPALDALNEVVVIAWFTGVNDEGKVQLAFSKDEGKTFSDAVRVDSGNATGRVDVVMLNEKEAGVLWMEPKGKDEVIQFCIVSLEGQTSEILTIAQVSAERASGFPQLAKYRDEMFVAWTVKEEEGKSIRVAKFSLNDF